MGKDSRSSRPTAIARLSIVYRRKQLTDTINMVAADRLSLKRKKRPAAAGLFLIQLTSAPQSSTILMVPLINTER